MSETIQDYKQWAKAHPNFMTPDLISVRKCGNYFIELSEGSDFNNKPCYGVSVIECVDGEFKSGTTTQSKAFFGSTARIKAECYFKGLEL